MRQNMTPLFTATKLKNMYYIMDKCAQDLVEYLKGNPKIWEGDCFETLMTFCNASVCASLFGIGTESIFESPFLKVGKEVLAPTVGNKFKFILGNFSPKLSKFLGLTLFKRFENLLIGAITQVVEERKKGTGKRHDFAELCVKIQENGTMRDPISSTELEPTYGLLSAQAMFFLLAGVEPVAIAMFVTLVEIGRNPDILAKVHQEIDDKFEKHNSNITYDVISEMTYVDQVLSEALRINPPIGLLNRVCTKDTVLPVGNIKVQKGTKIITPVYHLQNDPDFYPYPEVFDPERFAPGNKQRDEFYMPFGLGGRICIEARYSKLQMAAGIAHILRNFTVRTKELDGPEKFGANSTTVRPIDADVEFIPRNIK